MTEHERGEQTTMVSTVGGSSARQFNGVKVFSATLAQERELLGEKVTRWLAANPGVELVDKVVTQSSDQSFHCLSITLFFAQPAGAMQPAALLAPDRK